MLLSASLYADSVVVYDSFDGQWGNYVIGNTELFPDGTIYEVTSLSATDTLPDGSWYYNIALTTNLTDSFTFVSPFTANLTATFTCQSSAGCGGLFFAVESNFYLATDDPLFAYPLPYSASLSTSSDFGQMQYSDDGGDSFVVYIPPAYSVSGQFLRSGGISQLHWMDNIGVQSGALGTTWDFTASISVGQQGETVPEPATVLLLAAMLAGGLGWWRLRRRRSQ